MKKIGYIAGTILVLIIIGIILINGNEKETEVKYLEKDEAELFLKHCHDSEHYPFFLLLIFLL